MTRPWVLPGSNCQNELPKEDTKVSERKTAAVDDFATIKEALERIKKEEKEAQERAAKESEPVPEMDYSCNGVEVNLANSCADIYPDCEISEAYKEHQEYIKQAEAAGTYINDKVIEDALKILARRELEEAYKKQPQDIYDARWNNTSEEDLAHKIYKSKYQWKLPPLVNHSLSCICQQCQDKRKVRGCSCEMCYGRRNDLT